MFFLQRLSDTPSVCLQKVALYKFADDAVEGAGEVSEMSAEDC